jgi:hypothetical protein
MTNKKGRWKKENKKQVAGSKEQKAKSYKLT